MNYSKNRSLIDYSKDGELIFLMLITERRSLR
jgi:hypothetical protein